MTMKTIPKTVDSRAKAWNVFVRRLKFAEGLNNYLPATCDVTSTFERVGANIGSLTLPRGTWGVMKASDSANKGQKCLFILRAESTVSDLQFVQHSMYRGPLQQTYALSQSPRGKTSCRTQTWWIIHLEGKYKNPICWLWSAKNSSHLTLAAKMTNVLSAWIYCLSLGEQYLYYLVARGE